MNKQLPLAVALSLVLGGCATVTNEATNQIPATQPDVSPTLQSQTYSGLKRKVAIARFSNETKHGNSFLLNDQNDRVGKQAMDILSARLAETGQFIMLERADLDKVHSENALTGAASKTAVGADYLIVGSVSEFGRTTGSEVGVFSRNKIQTARAKVNIRLIDVTSGQIVFSQEGSGEAESEAGTVFGVGNRSGYDSSLDDKALSAAISKLVSNVVENLMDKPWQAYLIGEQDGLFIMTGGQSQGIKAGSEFAVVAQGKTVKNPQTGLTIQLPGKEVARIKVEAFAGEKENEISLCSVSSGAIDAAALDKFVIREVK